MTRTPTYLFSIDLEDVRSLLPSGQKYPERVPVVTERILAFLAESGSRCTFFTTGDVARRYPSLVRDIARQGHEIGCHSSDHTALDHLDRHSFKEDVLRCQDDFVRAGVERAFGYRAPYGSLVGSTSWAYEVLQELGFEYSASVVAAKNPLYGWPEFGPDRPCLRDGLPEFPSSLTRLPLLNVPFVGGVYFRVLPFPLVRRLFRARLESGDPVVGYLHPFDFDTEPEPFKFPGFEANPLYNWLMHRNRGAVFGRLTSLLEDGAEIVPFRGYVAKHRGALTANG